MDNVLKKLGLTYKKKPLFLEEIPLLLFQIIPYHIVVKRILSFLYKFVMTDGFEHRLNYYLLFKGNLNFKEKEETKIQKVEILLDKHGYDQILYDICERRIKYSTHEHFIPGNHIGFYYWAKWEYKWHPSQEYIECSKLNFPRCNNVDGEHYDFCSLLQKKNPTDPFKIYVLNESNENINY